MHRITTIIKEVLRPYIPAAEFHLDRGTLLHTIMAKEGKQETYTLDDPDNIVTPYLPAIKSFWQLPIEVLGIEEELKSERFGITGHLDLRCKYKGKLCIMDYKTNAETWTAKYQLGGYGFLAKENGLSVSKGYVVAMQKDGKYKLIPYDMAYLVLEFRSILRVFNILVHEKQVKEE